MKKNNIIYLNGLIDLAQARLGSKIVYKTDEFFAPAKRIINPWPPIYKEGVFDNHGKWMDGWETRRKRNKGHDFLILKLGKPGKIHKVDIDTSYFNGNQPSKVSLDACYCKSKLPNKNQKWINILKKKSTKPNSHHFFNIKNKSIFTHVKLNIYPDGGVARIRIYGEMKISKKFEKKIKPQKTKETFANLASLFQSFEIGKSAGKDLIYFIEDDYLHFETMLEEMVSSKSLSSGQMQKISIIRALLRKPDILFLEEATANLDSKSINPSFKSICIGKIMFEYWT